MDQFVNVKEIPKQLRGSAEAGSVIVAVGGGKGGIGKSFISSNLGIFLANMGFNTILVDLDLGAPNLHTCLGESLPTVNYHDYLRGKIKNFNDTAVATQFPKLRLVTGANDHSELANINLEDQSRLMSALFRNKADFTILDLSAGTHTSTLDFFLMAHRQIVTLTPDPTSIENAYRFMKASYYRKIKRFERQLQLETLVNDLMLNAEKNKIRQPSDLLNAVIATDPQRGQELAKIMKTLSFELVLNQARGSKDVQLASSIKLISQKYFGQSVSILGHIDYDNSVWHALRKRRPVLLEHPNSRLYSQIMTVARNLASPHLKKAVV